MKKVIYLVILSFAICISARFIFCYRIIPFPNTGELKYKENQVKYFPHIAFINPFKEDVIISKINEYFKANHQNEGQDKLIYFREKSIAKELKLLSMITEKDQYLILVSIIDNSEAQMVFILDKKTDLILGYY